MDPLLISIAAFIGVGGAIAAVALLFNQEGTKAEDRLEVLAGKKAPEGKTPAVTREALIQESMDGLSGMFQRFFEKFENLKLLFEQAESPLKPEAFLVLSGLLAILGAAGAIIARAPVPIYPVAALTTGLLPLTWLLWRRSKRFKRFGKQLPDALDLIGRALRSGNSLSQGMHLVTEEMPNPIAQEFLIAYEEQNLGVPVEVALKNVYKRIPNMDFKFFATAVAIQRQSGGDLSEILDKIGHIVRERFRIVGQVQALTGEGRISGVVLMGLPIALFFAVYYLNPDYVMLLFTDELGRKLIAGAAFLQVLGAVSIKKIIAIKI